MPLKLRSLASGSGASIRLDLRQPFLTSWSLPLPFTLFNQTASGKATLLSHEVVVTEIDNGLECAAIATFRRVILFANEVLSNIAFPNGEAVERGCLGVCMETPPKLSDSRSLMDHLWRIPRTLDEPCRPPDPSQGNPAAAGKPAKSPHENYNVQILDRRRKECCPERSHNPHAGRDNHCEWGH